MDPTISSSRPVPLLIQVTQACCEDDVSPVKNAIRLASLPGSRYTVEKVLSHAVFIAITKSAEKVLSHVLSEGATVPKHSHLPCGGGLPTIPILETLIANGWDINARHSRKAPFLWQALGDHDAVVWALGHGALVQPDGQEPYADHEYLRDHTDYQPILEQAVNYNCQIATLDLLRSRGAPITARVLHVAVQSAVSSSDALIQERIALVGHLLDTYNLDVNAFDQNPENLHSMGNHWGTPLCYVARKFGSCDAVVRLLLDRGADPDLSSRLPRWSAVTLAEQLGNENFLHVIAKWRKTTYRNEYV